MPTIVGLTDVDGVATEPPFKNHEAFVARMSHHRTVAPVIAAIATVTTTAIEPTIRRFARDRASRLASVMAVTVHEARVRATSNAQAATAAEYAPSPPFRWNSLSWCAHRDRGTTEATMMTLAIIERSTCRRTWGQPPERRYVTTAGSVAATPIKTAASETRAKIITAVKASVLGGREWRGTA
jgi:hypothetical protein